MEFSGIKKLTLLDWPGKTACIVFTAGCNLRCRFCHNPEFVVPERIEATRGDRIPAAAILSFLETRRGLLEGVVICGGEPTLQSDLADFCRRVKAMGFLVKLDTNGQRPEVVQSLLTEKLLDFIAMDFKQSPGKYDALTGIPGSGARALQTTKIILASGIDHEFRTTIARGEHTPEDITEICSHIIGAHRYALQNFRPGTTLDTQYHGTSFLPNELDNLSQIVKMAGIPCVVRK